MTNGNGPAAPASPAAALPTIKPADLRGILQYVPRFQGQIFVLALDGAIVADENFSNLLVDIAVLRSLGIRVVLVHGIGQQLRELSLARAIPITNEDGTGVTDAATLELALTAAAQVSQLILEGLTQNSLKCAITNAIRALPAGILRGVDQQHTGKVERVDKDFVLHLLNAGIVPIIPPVAYSPEGRALRVNSDLLAAEVAETLGATKILYLSPSIGLELDRVLRREIAVDELRELLKVRPEALPEVLRSKAAHAVRAIEAGVSRVHLVDGRVFDSLLNEVFSNEGVGTLIYASDYQQIRQARKGDVRFIWSLTRHAVRREELLNRTQQTIEKNIEQFYVFEIDENIIACVTLVFYPDQPQMAEVGSLYVLPFYQHRGIGKKMVDYACLRAQERGATAVVALSTQSYTFFTSKLGFAEADKSILPEARLKTYDDSGRNARVMLRPLA